MELKVCRGWQLLLNNKECLSVSLKYTLVPNVFVTIYDFRKEDYGVQEGDLLEMKGVFKMCVFNSLQTQKGVNVSVERTNVYRKDERVLRDL